MRGLVWAPKAGPQAKAVLPLALRERGWDEGRAGMFCSSFDDGVLGDARQAAGRLGKCAVLGQGTRLPQHCDGIPTLSASVVQFGFMKHMSPNPNAWGRRPSLFWFV